MGWSGWDGMHPNPMGREVGGVRSPSARRACVMQGCKKGWNSSSYLDMYSAKHSTTSEWSTLTGPGSDSSSSTASWALEYWSSCRTEKRVLVEASVVGFWGGGMVEWDGGVLE